MRYKKIKHNGYWGGCPIGFILTSTFLPLRKIWYLFYPHVGDRFPDANEMDYEIVKEFLIKNKKW